MPIPAGVAAIEAVPSLVELGRDGQALPLYEFAATKFREGGDGPRLASAYKDHASLLRRLGRLEEAIEVYASAENVYGQIGEVAQAAWQRSIIGDCHRSLGNLPAAFEAYRQSRAAFHEVATDEAVYGVAINDRDAALVALELAEYDIALENANEGVIAFGVLGNIEGINEITRPLSDALYEGGDWSRAAAALHLRRVGGYRHSLPELKDAAETELRLAECRLRTGRFAEAVFGVRGTVANLVAYGSLHAAKTAVQTIRPATVAP